MDIIQGIKAILKSVSSLQSLNKEAPKAWSTVKLTLTRIADEGGSKVYQGSDLSNYTEAMLRKCFTDGLADLKNLDTALKERLSLVRYKTSSIYYCFSGHSLLESTYGQ